MLPDILTELFIRHHELDEMQKDLRQKISKIWHI